MSQQLRGFFKRITGDQASYDALAKPPIADAETKLKLFNDATSISVAALESYLKSMSKLIDQTLSERFSESKELFARYDKPQDQVYGTVLGKLSLVQGEMNNDVSDFVRNVEANVLRPLMDYQEELKVVKENKKELKEAYDKIEQCRVVLDKHKKEADSAHRTNKSSDLLKFDERVNRSEKELEEATAVANEKYDKYTETLFKKISEECELSNNYVNYLNAQRKYHKRALKKLDLLIPEVDETIHNYHKKPVFGGDLEEYVERSRRPGNLEEVSPVIKKLTHSMCAQNAFEEEGIFRIAGSRVKMNCLLNAINSGYLDVLDTTNDFDVHCLAGVLKQYIRELPDSLLCNDFYEDWIEAIGTNPMPAKLEAYKKVLENIPKVNFENIRYLIKFLSKIVENSDKTKMTTSNMGICFGVSLLSSGGPLNNKSNSLSGKNEPRVIDMATATNVFDFLLTNHKELFSEDIDFSSKKNYSTLSRATASLISKDLQHEHSNLSANSSFSNNNKFPESSPVISKLVPIAQDNHENSINDFNYGNNNNNNNNSSPYMKGGSNNLNFNSPLIMNANSPNVMNTNRHIKQNKSYFEPRGMDSNNEMFASNSSINSTGSLGNLNGQNNKALSSPSQNSADPGSVSPRRSKKMAPAPPPAPRTLNTHTTGDFDFSPSANASEIHRSPPKLPNSGSAHLQPSSILIQSVMEADQSANVVSQTTPIFPKLSSNPINSPPTSALKINPSYEQTDQHSPSVSPSMSTTNHISFKTTSALEKPTQPPPNIPNRPPPIGFNVTGMQVDSSNSHRNFGIDSIGTESANKLNSNSNTTLLSSSSSSAISSSSQEILNSTTTTSNSATQLPAAKGPKPAVPRRPTGNMIAAHLKQFDPSVDSNAQQHQQQQQNKSSSEITSL